MLVAFFGTPRFAEVILARLIATEYRPILVVTALDKPQGRKRTSTPSPTKILAKKHRIPINQPEKLNETTSHTLKSKSWDFFIVAAYGKIIPKEIIDIPKYGVINIHPSLLPKYRGASPIQAVILSGDEKTGATIMLMDEKMDHGPIIAQQELEIRNPIRQLADKISDSPAGGRNKSAIQMSKITTPELTERLAELSADLLLETLPKWILGKIEPQEQNHDQATFTKIIKKEDGHIDWNKSAEEIERITRAYTPWPGAYAFWQSTPARAVMARENKPHKIAKHPRSHQLKILSARSIQARSDPAEMGGVIKYNDGFGITCGEGVLVPKKVQLEGKRTMDAEEFLRGYPGIIGAQLM